jgi:hypothetical protein
MSYGYMLIFVILRKIKYCNENKNANHILEKCGKRGNFLQTILLFSRSRKEREG